MGLLGLSQFFLEKYAGLKEDTSFGVPINAEKTQILKDKLILIYDKINQDVTHLPGFKKINKELAGNLYLEKFNDLINNLVANVARLNLKDSFSYSVLVINELNNLRDSLVSSKLPREKVLELDSAVKNIQDTIWKESKRILNLHDLRGILIDVPEEVQESVNTIIPTWDYGPGKNPSKGLLHKRPKRERPNDLMKRLLNEIKEGK